ncbi:MAG: DUF455 family protein [Myxococcota bacterium]
MDVDDLAERVLTGTTLADKLAPWGDVSSQGTGRAVPRVPGRPPELALPEQHRKLPPVASARLETEAGRARVLHELANHELQAIELFAAALLRWPDAPAGFRRGLIANLADEQRHCRMYLARLEAAGGSVGDQPVSRFFWDTLGGIDDPTAFVAGLSLCFEQANLDFCQQWRVRFAEAGDLATAAVLQAVYDDEIRHVAHGLVWFSRWTEGDRVDAWADHLPHPLTPARGRGGRFDAEGRLRAGFTPGEVDALRVRGGSRGRPGRAVWFDAGIEDVLADGRRSPMATALNADLATLPMFLLKAEDVVVAPRPSTGFLARLADAGFEIPRFAPSLAELGAHPVAAIEPWGPCPSPLHVGEAPVRTARIEWNPAWAALSSKAETVRRARGFVGHPSVVAELGEVWTEPGDPGTGPWVLKAPFSTSGSRRMRGDGPLTKAQRTWLDRQLAAHGEVVWQPWYTRVVDVSVHVTVGERVRIDGITRFETSRTGAFEGTWLGSWVQGLPESVRRGVHGDGSAAHAVQPVLEQAATAAGEWARSLGLFGPLSIDAAVVDTPDGLRVHPWLETNARLTLGRVALALRARVHPRASARWRVERANEPRARELREAPPPELRDGRIVQGVLATTDPEASTALLTWLDVG